ncbi:MAG: CoA-binding protein [Candidatus Brockarchaeota archaeon]|nr:CoA-binding protein [Candidatus Brockarchaeota archaeon]
MPIVEQAIRLKQKHGKPLFIWMQLGIINLQAAELAEKAGLSVIINRCMIVEKDGMNESREKHLATALFFPQDVFELKDNIAPFREFLLTLDSFGK